MKQTKKKLYQLLVSTSLLSSAFALPMVTMQAVYANGGTFTVGGAELNVRRSPSTNSDIVAKYQPGQVVEYDSIVEGDGYRWISYVGASGNRNYVAIGTTDGSQSFGNLSGGGSSTASQQVSDDFSAYAGEWVNNQGERFTFSASGSLSGAYNENQVYIFKTNPDGSVYFAGVGALAGGLNRWPAYYPVGVSDELTNNSDASKERFVAIPDAVSQLPLPESAYFYRVGEQVTTKTTKDNKDEEEKIEDRIVYEFEAKSWTGDNPYKSYLVELTTFKDVDYLKDEIFNYALYDIDNNGTPELLVGHATKKWIQAVYTLVDDKPYMVTMKRGEDGGAGYNGVILIYDSGEIELSESRSGSRSVVREVFVLDKDDQTPEDPQVEYLQIGTESESQIKIKGTKTLKASSLDWKAVTDEDSAATSSEIKTKTSETKSESSSTDSTTSESSPSESATTASQPKEGNAVQRLYQAITRRKNLPTTGEAVSVLGAVGLGILAIVVAVLKKRKK